MPTRYTLDVDLKTVFTSEAYSSRENLRAASVVRARTENISAAAKRCEMLPMQQLQSRD